MFGASASFGIRFWGVAKPLSNPESPLVGEALRRGKKVKTCEHLVDL
jgi:hypothetical protein